ncbi:MAG: DUF485 domain-containing protein [Pseudonocardiales bacterium]
MSSPSPTEQRAESAEAYVAVASSAEFAALRRTFRRFVFPMTAIFLGWYLLFVLMSNYAADFMSHKVIGNVHVGMVFGLLQFVSTFVITTVYARWASRRFDPLADEVAEKVGLHTDSGGTR